MRAPHISNIRASARSMPSKTLRYDAPAEPAGVGEEPRARDGTATPTTPTSADLSTGQVESESTQNAFPQVTTTPNPPMMPIDASPPFPAASFNDFIMDTLLWKSDVLTPDKVGTRSQSTSIFS